MKANYEQLMAQTRAYNHSSALMVNSKVKRCLELKKKSIQAKVLSMLSNQLPSHTNIYLIILLFIYSH